MSLQLTFAIEPDEHGVVDGRLLAQQLIAVAFRALVPYVDGCHGCADKFFGLIANEVLADLHDQGHATGHLDGDIWPTRRPRSGSWPASRAARPARSPGS